MKETVLSKGTELERRKFLFRLVAGLWALGVGKNWPAQEGFWVTPPKSPFLLSVLDESFDSHLKGGSEEVLLRLPRLVREWFGCEVLELNCKYFLGDRSNRIRLATRLYEAAAASRVQILILTLSSLPPQLPTTEAAAEQVLGQWIDVARAVKCHSVRLRLPKEKIPEGQLYQLVLGSANLLAHCGLGLLVEPSDLVQLKALPGWIDSARVANLGICARLDYAALSQEGRSQLLQSLKEIHQIKAVTLVWKSTFRLDGEEGAWCQEAISAIVKGGFRGYVGLLWNDQLNGSAPQITEFVSWLRGLRDRLST